MSPMLGGFIDRATVYQQDTNGEFTVVVKQNLHCRVVAPQIRPVDVGRERNELTDLRYFEYDPQYVFPNEFCQVLVKGTTYNTVSGTFRSTRNPVGKVVLKRCDAVRVNPSPSGN